MTTFDKVKALLSEQLFIDQSIIQLDSRLTEDLKADSANVMVLIMSMEDNFGIEVDDSAILNFKTVKDVVDYIEKTSR